MRILVLSDSHGRVDNMAVCVERTEPNHILHLGDCVRDAERLARQFPAIPMTTVPGNCDYGALDEPEKLIELGGRRILMMHGHTRGVKYDPQRAIYAAREYGADVLLFGHTHCPLVDFDGSLYVMNPGTVGGRGNVATYGIITVNDKAFDCSTYRL
jgi:putative phosphoesterase